MAGSITFYFDPVDDVGLVVTEDERISFTFDAGIPGEDGNTVRYGSGAPNNSLGVDGDFYINTSNNFIYGPKASGVWPAGTSLVGPAGPAGPSLVSDATDIDPAITDASADSPYLLASSLTPANKARKIPLGATGRSLLGAASAAAAATILGLGSYARLDAANTFTLGQTVQSLTLSGNISSPAWATNGLRIRGVAATLTDTTSTGTVAAAYTDAFGGNTIAATNATTFTDYYTAFFRRPIAGTNATLTNRWALGAETLAVGTAKQFQVDANGLVRVAAAASANRSTQSLAQFAITNSSNVFKLFVGHDATATNLYMLDGAGTQCVNIQAFNSGTSFNGGTNGLSLSSGGSLGFVHTAGSEFLTDGMIFYFRGNEAGVTTQDRVLIRTSATYTGDNLSFQAFSSTATQRKQSCVKSAWATSTDATRQGRWSASAYGIVASVETLQEGLRVEANSAGVRTSVNGVAAVARQSLPAAATDAATTQTLANALRTALIAFGVGV